MAAFYRPAGGPICHMMCLWRPFLLLARLPVLPRPFPCHLLCLGGSSSCLIPPIHSIPLSVPLMPRSTWLVLSDAQHHVIARHLGELWVGGGHTCACAMAFPRPHSAGDVRRRLSGGAIYGRYCQFNSCWCSGAASLILHDTQVYLFCLAIPLIVWCTPDLLVATFHS